MNFKKILFLFPILFLFSKIYPLEIPERPLGRVSDYAKILRPEEVSTLEAILSNYERETSNQIVIAIFNSLEGWEIEDFSIRLAEKWKIGQKGRDNGIIILVALSERKIRIEVGYGLEGAVPDITARDIIDRKIVPYFKKSDYFNGLREGVDSLIKAIGGEYKVEGGKEGIMTPLLAFLIILVIFGILYLNERFYGYTYTRSRGKWHRRATFWGGFFGGGGWSSGSGGGFSGGGGNFGGGGATGSW
jgi:uncharacterized protein